MPNHGWKVLKQLPAHPQRCAVFPHLGQTSGHLFLDTGQDISPARRDPHIYISDVAIAEMAKLFGFVPKSEVHSLKADLLLAEARADVLEKRVAELEEFKSAVDIVTSTIGA